MSRNLRIFSDWRSLFQSGDTIVEVLIAMAVISVVLGGAYVSSQASIKGTRDSQEHSEALKIAETQVEELRARAASGAVPSGIITTPNLSFCFDTASGNASTTFNLPTNFLTDDFSSYPTNPPHLVSCVTDSNSVATTSATNSVQYHTGIVFDGTKLAYVVHVRWDRLGGSKDEVTLTYRFH